MFCELSIRVIVTSLNSRLAGKIIPRSKTNLPSPTERRKLLELESNNSLVLYSNQPVSFRYQLIDNGLLGFDRPPPSLARTAPMMPYATSSRPAIVFPLPLDHLLTLVQYNVLRAIVTNMSIVPVVQLIPVECRAVLNIPPSTRFLSYNPDS